MQYNQIYNICQPVIDWLKEHYPHNHKIIISTNGAELIEDGKLIALDKDLKETVFNQEVILPKEQKEEMQKILDIDTSEIKDDVHRLNIELLQKLIRYGNQSKPKIKIVRNKFMTKSELLSSYKAPQLADMVIRLQSASKVKNDEIHKLKWQISSLEEENGRLQSKLDTYNNYLLPRCTKEAKEMIDHNHFTGVRIVTWEQWNNRGEKSMNISDIQKCQEEYEKLLKESPLEGVMNKISIDILEQKNNAMAMEFTRIICDLLKRYGVYVHCTETKFGEKITTNSIEEQYGIAFDSMDFSQHDKEFTDKIEELQSEVEKYRKAFEDAKKERDCQIAECQKKIEELKVENAELHCEMQAMKVFPDEIPTEPIKVAEMLITAKRECEPLHIGNDVFEDTYRIFEVSELKQIAEHLLVYCNHHKGEEE